ncbi:MAG: metallophosphoesterase [Planctomycetota bacterium]
MSIITAPDRASTGIAPVREVSRPAPRFEDVPINKRHWVWEAFDEVAIRANRILDRIPVFRMAHDRVLRGMEVVEIELDVPKSQAGLDGLRLAFASDLHAGSYLDEKRISNLFGRIRMLEPDLLCLGGDLVNSRLKEVKLYERALADHQFRYGIYAVAGNHDRRWARDIGVWQDFFEDRGVKILANHGERLEHGGASVWIGGVDDYSDGAPDVGCALRGREDGECTVMLAHQPDHFVDIAPHGVDLVLSGHTHAGQVRPFGQAWICHTKHGLLEGGYEREGSRLHVSRGAGLTILPVRWNARPEITMVTFRSR